MAGSVSISPKTQPDGPSPARPARIRSKKLPVTASAARQEPEPVQQPEPPYRRPEPQQRREPEPEPEQPQEPEQPPREPEQRVRCCRRRTRSGPALPAGRSEQVWSSSSIPQKSEGLLRSKRLRQTSLSV